MKKNNKNNNKYIVIESDVRLPNSNIVLEKGDKILVLEKDEIVDVDSLSNEDKERNFNANKLAMMNYLKENNLPDEVALGFVINSSAFGAGLLEDELVSLNVENYVNFDRLVDELIDTFPKCKVPRGVPNPLVGKDGYDNFYLSDEEVYIGDAIYDGAENILRSGVIASLLPDSICDEAVETIISNIDYDKED